MSIVVIQSEPSVKVLQLQIQYCLRSLACDLDRHETSSGGPSMTRHPGNGHAPLSSLHPLAPVIVAELSDRALALVHPFQVDHFFLEAILGMTGHSLIG